MKSLKSLVFEIVGLVTIFGGAIASGATGVAGPLAFRFGSTAGSNAVTNWYSSELGYGFEPGAELNFRAHSVASVKPFSFSIRVPEGNYLVTATFGDALATSTNALKAEARRLFVERIVTTKGNPRSQSFVVNVRTPQIDGETHVKLKARERETEMISWDDRLTLEVLGAAPSLQSLEVKPVVVPTVFLSGDSTVCDQPREPWNSWGQMLPRFFGPEIAVANYAQSGESIKSSLGARRFDKIFSRMRTNDWLFIQFGHNDMKDKATNALSVYKSNLKKIVAQTRAKGATPVLITSMERKAGLARDTLAGYPQTVRDVAQEEGVALIDLHAMSRIFYQALGGNLDLAFQDGTHHNNYGSYELARCVVEGIRTNVPTLAKFLAADAKMFDPARPDDQLRFQIPASAAVDDKKPDGN